MLQPIMPSPAAVQAHGNEIPNPVNLRGVSSTSSLGGNLALSFFFFLFCLTLRMYIAFIGTSRPFLSHLRIPGSRLRCMYLCMYVHSNTSFHQLLSSNVFPLLSAPIKVSTTTPSEVVLLHWFEFKLVRSPLPLGMIL
ncbi:hypothetical protein BDV39DRAFT_106477 [Aspergillus sergii]|uniref:Uncharacterized protein n=1 Tax=Aspergillus sergii TaxID=1034303 RepID=A0A5N6XHY0_9EURO|nr:hypothetical protein BDV39DRAFT_106477 [Aspergillus sergii]